MLHLFDLRQLQSELNSLIVLGQEYTANPLVTILFTHFFLHLILIIVLVCCDRKTNASLGQVGR